jgi:hypothetical protein
VLHPTASVAHEMENEDARALPGLQIQQSRTTRGYTATLAVGAAWATGHETAMDNVYVALWPGGASDPADVLMEAICDLLS